MAYDAQAFASGQTASGNGPMDMLGQQMAGLQVQGAQIQNAAAGQQMAMQRIALQRQQQYTSDVQSFAQNPTVNGLASLWKYPEFQASTKGIYDAMDPRMRQAEATQLGSVAAILQGAQNKDGSYNPTILQKAAAIAQQRIDADKAAGRDTTGDEQALSMIQSGDPQQINAVKGLTATLIAGAVGFDKAAPYLSAIGLNQEPVKTSPGDTYTNPVTSQVAASQPSNLSPQTLNIPGGAQELVGFNPNPGATNGTATTQAEGGGQTSGGATGLQGAVATVLHNEGGLNKSDMNGYPTNFGINYKANQKELAALGIKSPAQMGNLTQDQAAQIYASKYWPQSGAANLPANLQTPYFDVYVRNPAMAKKALAQSGGDPQKFVQIASGYFQGMAANDPKAAKYQAAWADRDANNLALATGAVPQAAQANPQGGAAPQASGAPLAPGVIASTGNTGALNTQGAEPGHAWNAPHTGQITVPGTDADPAQYQAEIDPAARNWIFTNQFPTGAGGMGGGGTLTLGEKNAIVQRAMQLWTAAGHSPEDLKTVRKQYEGLGSSLQQATQTLSSLSAAEDGLQRDANLVLSTHRILADPAPNNPNGMGIVKDSGPAGGLVSNSFANNTKLDWYETHGSPAQQAAVKAYKDAVNAYSSSYSKFMTASNGVGGSAAPSDAARNQAGELNDEGLGPTALRTHLQTVLAEAENKRQGWQHQVTMLGNKLNSLGNLPSAMPQAQQPNALPPGARLVGTYQGRRVIEVNGQRLVEQ